MKIATIVKSELTDPKTYTTHRTKVFYHPEKLFLSDSDKAAVELAVKIAGNNGQVDLFTLEQGEVGVRVLHEALAMGAASATEFVGSDPNDPANAYLAAEKVSEYLKDQGYDLILVGDVVGSAPIAAYLAENLGFNLYENVTRLSPNWEYETELDRGQLKGKVQTPAVLTVEANAIEPELPSFPALEAAQKQTIKSVALNLDTEEASEVVVNQTQHPHVIWNLDEEPDAVEKLVAALRQDGIMK
ncbi:hypothetical protein [Lactobacillus corticis]|uniref:Electron transfer flavoprotein alpha/beta-subunit N-terminal domain-containing protein n=1 Tax=Lactobacillus corticis TaxID=2201249 RepID=A0A916QJI8_9LACO|nr:hypothetical protein [Lactobacillus corticis]GFZ27472.1 hypothetical protein LCB40_13520 [Lactobacillus corticis]